MSHLTTLPTLIIIVGFNISLLLLGMCNILLGVGPLWLRLPPPSAMWRKASTSRDSPPTIIVKGHPPPTLIPNEGFLWQNEDVAWALCDCRVVTMACTLPIRAWNCCCCFLSCLAKASLYEGGLVVAAATLIFPLALSLIYILSPSGNYGNSLSFNNCSSFAWGIWCGYLSLT